MISLLSMENSRRLLGIFCHYPRRFLSRGMQSWVLQLGSKARPSSSLWLLALFQSVTILMIHERKIYILYLFTLDFKDSNGNITSPFGHTEGTFSPKFSLQFGLWLIHWLKMKGRQDNDRKL